LEKKRKKRKKSYLVTVMVAVFETGLKLEFPKNFMEILYFLTLVSFMESLAIPLLLVLREYVFPFIFTDTFWLFIAFPAALVNLN
jgi:hypothetical protein